MTMMLKFNKTKTSEIHELKYKKEISSETDESFECLYYKVVSCSEIDCELPVYGIKVEKICSSNKEMSSVKDICVNEEDIEDLLELIAHHDVTPISLKEVVFDWIYQNTYY